MIKSENDTPDFVFVPFTLLNALNYSITDDDKVLLRVQHSYPAFDINDREMTRGNRSNFAENTQF